MNYWAQYFFATQAFHKQTPNEWNSNETKFWIITRIEFLKAQSVI